MTVPSTTRRAGPYLGNDVTTSFPFTFKVFSTSDIALTLTDALGTSTTLVLDTDYSVTLNVDQDSSPGGSVTYPLSGAPLATGETLVGLGALPYDQTTDLPSGGPYRATTVEDTFDRTVFQIQQLAEAQGRALTLSPASPAGVSVTLPTPEANKVLGWNLAENALVNYDNSGGGGGTTLPSIAGQAGKFLTNNGAALSWGTPAAAGFYKNAKTDFGCVGDGTTDDTTNMQTAVTTCENNGWALFIPHSTYKLTSTITQTKRLHVFGEGRGLTVLSTSATVGWLVTVALAYGNTYSYWHDFTIQPATGGGGTNGFKAVLTSDGGVSFSYMSNWQLERVEIGDFGGYGINLDNGVGNLNGFFRFSIRECWIRNGVILNKVGDSIDIANNTVTDGATIQAARAGGRIGFLYTGLPGARQVVFQNNNVTTSAGAFALFAAEQPRLYANQIEHPVYYQIPYYAGATTYGAMIYLNNCPGAVLRDNTIGAGGATTVVTTGTTTSGNNSVTGLASTTGLYVGCTVKGNGIPNSTRILTIVGTTITLSNNAGANGVQTLTFGYSPDSSVFIDNGTINTTMDTNELASGAHWHYTIASGSYNNNTSGTCVYTGVSTTAQINDQNTGASCNFIEDPVSNYTQANEFYNSYCDIWNGTDPTNTFASGFVPQGAATASRSTGTVYPGNPSQVSLSVNSSGATINNGVDITPANQPWRETGWISGAIAIYTNSATSGGVDVFFVNGVTVTKVGRAAVAGGWTLVRFRCRINAGNNWSVRLATSDGAGTYTSGWGFFVGGVHLCRGPYMPTNIFESPSRRSFVVTGGVGFAPTFQGQRAFLTGTGKWYLAANSLLNTDWIILN